MRLMRAQVLGFLLCPAALASDPLSATAMNAPLVPPTEPVAPAISTPSAGEPPVQYAPATELPATDEGRFSLDIRPQIWVPSVSGTVGVGSRTAHVDESFTDIWQNSDSVLGLSGRVTVAYDRLEAYTDITWIRLGFDKVTTPAGVQFSTTTALMIADACVAYNFLETPADRRSRQGSTLAPYAGARIFWANTSVDASEPPLSDSASSVWADPIVGLMWETPFGDAGRFSIAADVGGFGVSSQLTWQATALIGVDFECMQRPTTLSIGMRAIADNYSTSGKLNPQFDAILWGPILAWNIRF